MFFLLSFDRLSHRLLFDRLSFGKLSYRATVRFDRLSYRESRLKVNPEQAGSRKRRR